MAVQGFSVKSRFGEYHVEFCESLSDCIRRRVGSGPAFILADQRVYDLYQTEISASDCRVILWEATEANKTYQNLERVFELLLDAGFKKNSHLVVIGGGILQDVGGFVASTLYRGVSWDFIPTTLLAQADSCIGAKTSVNLNRAKNLIGTFYPPQTLSLTPTVLGTLSPGDVRSGLCEAVKLAMLDSVDHVEWMRPRLNAALDLSGVDELVHRALLIKKSYIERDELDRGIRNLLNYGHTFGHAFESGVNFSIPHGIAVGIGMVAAVTFSKELGFVSQEHLDDVRRFLAPLVSSSLRQLKGFGAKAFIEVMKSDKKNTSNDITFVLTRGYGKMFKHTLGTAQTEILLTQFLAELSD